MKLSVQGTRVVTVRADSAGEAGTVLQLRVADRRSADGMWVLEKRGPSDSVVDLACGSFTATLTRGRVRSMQEVAYEMVGELLAGLDGDSATSYNEAGLALARPNRRDFEAARNLLKSALRIS